MVPSGINPRLFDASTLFVGLLCGMGAAAMVPNRGYHAQADINRSE